MNFDFAFKVEDDIYFLKEGWDNIYCHAYARAKVAHLLYHDPDWRRIVRGNACGEQKPALTDTKYGLQSKLKSAEVGMGVFWTFNKKVINKVGYFDCVNFGLCGNGHQDFTARCCRAGFNRRRNPWDALGSQNYARMVYEDYSLAGIGKERNKASKIGPNGPQKFRKGKLIQDKKRMYVPYNENPYNMRGEFLG